MVVPRPAAALAMNVVAVWNDCRAVDDLPFSAPPAQDHPCPARLPDGTPFLSSECLLGMYVYEHLRLNGSQMRWMSDSRFDMQPRRAPGELHASGMVMEVNYIPGRWNVTATGARQRVAFEGGKPVAEAKRSYYRERYESGRAGRLGREGATGRSEWSLDVRARGRARHCAWGEERIEENVSGKA